MMSFAPSRFRSTPITLDITDSAYVCNQCTTQKTGTAKMHTFSTNTGTLDARGNNYTKLIAQDIVDNSDGVINFRDNQLSEVDLRNMISGGIDCWGNPITTGRFDSVATIEGEHIYLAHNHAMVTPPPFPALVTSYRALVFSQNVNMTGRPSTPLWENMYHEYEQDYTKVNGIDLPKLKVIRHQGSLPAGIVAGGDLGDIPGGSGKSPCAYLDTPLLEELSGCISIATTSTTVGFTTWNYDNAKWLTLGDHFNITLTRNLLTQAFMDALLSHLATIASGSYTNTGEGPDYPFNTIDMTNQTTGAKPSSTGLDAIAVLSGLNITTLVDA